jgi:hypothetical protein
MKIADLIKRVQSTQACQIEDSIQIADPIIRQNLSENLDLMPIYTQITDVILSWSLTAIYEQL